MRTITKRKIITVIILTVSALTLPSMLFAMGNSEKLYPEALEGEFVAIAEQLKAGEIDRAEALDMLHDFRRENKRDDNEDYQSMEQLLIRVQTKEMTLTQAREQLRLLDECKEENSEIKLQQQEENTVRTQLQTTSRTATQTNKPEQESGGSAQSSGSDGGSSKSKSK